MLSWFSRKCDCPIPEESRAWVERRMAWVMGRFGGDRVRQARVVLPTPEYFPDEYDRSEAAGELLFDNRPANAARRGRGLIESPSKRGAR